MKSQKNVDAKRSRKARSPAMQFEVNRHTGKFCGIRPLDRAAARREIDALIPDAVRIAEEVEALSERVDRFIAIVMQAAGGTEAFHPSRLVQKELLCGGIHLGRAYDCLSELPRFMASDRILDGDGKPPSSARIELARRDAAEFKPQRQTRMGKQVKS